MIDSCHKEWEPHATCCIESERVWHHYYFFRNPILLILFLCMALSESSPCTAPKFSVFKRAHLLHFVPYSTLRLRYRPFLFFVPFEHWRFRECVKQARQDERRFPCISLQYFVLFLFFLDGKDHGINFTSITRVVINISSQTISRETRLRERTQKIEYLHKKF